MGIELPEAANHNLSLLSKAQRIPHIRRLNFTFGASIGGLILVPLAIKHHNSITIGPATNLANTCQQPFGKLSAIANNLRSRCRTLLLDKHPPYRAACVAVRIYLLPITKESCLFRAGIRRSMENGKRSQRKHLI
ncbi:hypothetical protein ONS95_005863 [Cadophora gregata]|uniref:uncharacterized protein n=1 Tax=Cadophora gregata TaxID=51156 RepID=UPI0026DC5F57|nr:uncharacterized protein ONS95_005863 [Cadophora gregata]KAK0102240.1 hypothetical protein ONS95_005863 [Cadophora gregata]KAK0103868.1 hypothetical protein ONS96_004977 [Cadophora gregata f. sp. sojae]